MTRTARPASRSAARSAASSSESSGGSKPASRSRCSSASAEATAARARLASRGRGGVGRRLGGRRARARRAPGAPAGRAGRATARACAAAGRARARRRACPAARSGGSRAGRRGAATSGCSRRICQKRPPSHASRAGASRVPWWTCTRSPCSGSRPANSSSASSRYVGRSPTPADTTTSPRRDLVDRDAGQVERHALAGRGALERLVVDLDAADARAPAAGQEHELVAAADLARPQRAGDHGPGAADREHAVDVQARRRRRRRPGCAALRRPGRARRAARPARRPCARKRPPTSASGQQLGRLERSPARGRPGRTWSPRPRRRARRAPRSTAACSRVWGITPSSAATVIRYRSMPVAPGDHRAHEALVAGHVDHRQPAAGRQRQLRVAELDRDPARALLGQPVGVDAGQRADQRGLAVIDVARGAERQRRGAHRAPAPARARARRGGSTSSSRSVRGSSSTRPSWIRAITGGSPSRSARASATGLGVAGQRHGRALELEQRQRAAADLARRRGRPSAAAPIASRSRSRPRGERPARRSRASPARVSRAAPARGRGTASASPRAPPATACRSAAPARAGGARRGRDRVGASDQQARPAVRRAACRPSSRPAPRPRRPSAERRLVGQRGDPGRVGSTPEPTSSITGTPSPHSSSIATSSTKPTERKFDGCTRRIAPTGRLRARAPARSRPAACGWSSPPRPASAPDWAITSGIRKPPPISTSWPRETTIVAARPGRARRRRAAPRRRRC